LRSGAHCAEAVLTIRDVYDSRKQSSDEQPFRNRIREELPTIHQGTAQSRLS